MYLEKNYFQVKPKIFHLGGCSYVKKLTRTLNSSIGNVSSKGSWHISQGVYYKNLL